MAPHKRAGQREREHLRQRHAPDTPALAALEPQPRAHERNGADRARGEHAPQPERRARGPAGGQRDRCRRSAQRERAAQFGAQLARAARQVERERNRRSRCGQRERDPDGAVRAPPPEHERSSGHERAGRERALGQAGARVELAAATVGHEEPQRHTREERCDRGQREPQARRRERDEQPEHDGLGEERPAAVLGGQEHEAQRCARHAGAGLRASRQRKSVLSRPQVAVVVGTGPGCPETPSRDDVVPPYSVTPR